MNNEAFIDGQNLYLGTKQAEESWEIDLKKFRFYLYRKYKVIKAYYFIGYFNEEHIDLYKSIAESGYYLIFRKHSKDHRSIKKGNVDTDLVFEVMKKIAENEAFDRVVLVSGDGDYYKMVEYLIKKDRFCKLLAPNERRMSSLYRILHTKYFTFLNQQEIIKKIGK